MSKLTTFNITKGTFVDCNVEIETHKGDVLLHLDIEDLKRIHLEISTFLQEGAE
jgi:hypothetical protein